MKLLMISGDRSILQRKRGAFWYTLQELRKHFACIDIICPRIMVSRDGRKMARAGESSLARESLGGSVTFHPCPWRLICQPIWIIRKGRALVREHNHDVMTVHEYPPFYNGVGAGLLARNINVPYALEVHHIVGYPESSSLKERIGRILSRMYLPSDAKGAKAVRAVNSFVEKQLVEWGVPEEKIKVVPSLYLNRELLTSVECPPVIYDVSFCARLVPNKRLYEVIQAVHSLHDVHLVVIGDGPERRRCEDLVRTLGIENRVTFLGWLPSLEAVIGAVRSAKIFVMNSRSEGGPRNALEAMACGMPVIVTPVGVMPEVIQDGVNGVFTTGKPDDLAKKILSLLNDDAMRNRLANEAPKILERFEHSKLVKGYADFLKSLT